MAVAAPIIAAGSWLAANAATIGAVASAASAAVGVAGALKKPKAPQTILSGGAATTPAATPADTAQAVRSVQDRARRQAVASAGRASTILTSQQGIQSLGGTQLATNTILGA